MSLPAVLPVAAPTVADFEDLDIGEVVTGQLAAMGVTFPAPGPTVQALAHGAHSGDKVISRSCRTPTPCGPLRVTMIFRTARSRVRLWAGACCAEQTVELVAFDGGGREVVRESAELDFSNRCGDGRVACSLEVVSAARDIALATLTLSPAESEFSSRKLLLDDLETDVASAAVPPPDRLPRPTLQLDRTSVLAGEPIEFRGRRYAGETRLFWDALSVRTLLATAVPDRTGAIAGRFTVPSETSPGAHAVIACGGPGGCVPETVTVVAPRSGNPIPLAVGIVLGLGAAFLILRAVRGSGRSVKIWG
jgi:hypothetical protein